MKNALSFLVAAVGTVIGIAFGGWSKVLEVLIYLMIFDYVTGMASAFYHKELSSKVGFKGLFKKFMILVICSVAYKIDCLMNANGMVLNAAYIFYCCNESLSIIENAIELGLPIPNKLKEAIEVLNKEDLDES